MPERRGFFTIRLTATERALVDEAARASGLSTGAFLRTVGLDAAARRLRAVANGSDDDRASS